jgi:hypothetical protein
MFSKETNTSSPCEFGIIDLISKNKELSVIDNFYYIKNYKCFYGFSENIYNQHPELQKEVDIKSFVLKKAQIAYYYILDARNLTTEQLYNKLEIIKTLDIKPKFISIVLSSHNEVKTCIENTKKILDQTNIDWKIHSFINSESFNHCINILAETTIQYMDNVQYILFDDGNEYDHNLSDIVNHMHYSYRVLQSGVSCIVLNTNSLHMMSMSIALYKSLVSMIGLDIIESLNQIPNLVIGNYDIAESK